jgi:hypothetical protein
VRWLTLGMAAVTLAFASCTQVELANPKPNVPIDGGGAGGEPSGEGSRSGGGAGGEAGEGPSQSGAPSSISVGVWPTFAVDPEERLDVQAVAASVATLAVGSRVLPLYEPWSELVGPTGTPHAETWSRLDAMAKPYHDRGASVALCIGIVDRIDARWPFGAGLDSKTAASTMRRTIDEVYAHYAGYLSHLCLGYEIDRYWSEASASEGSALLSFLSSAVDYASQHPMRGKTAVGVAVTLGALAGAKEAPLDQLLIGDEAVVVYDPFTETGELAAPGAIADELAAAAETLASLPGRRMPLALFEAGYPSAGSSGSSEKAQRTYFDALAGALSGLSADGMLAFVGIYGLGDRESADCAAEAPSFGSSPGLLVRAQARCSMGLRAENGTEKLAWPSALGVVNRTGAALR